MLGLDTNALVRSLPVIIETEWALRSRYTFDKAAVLAPLSDLMAARELTFEDEPVIEEALYRWKDSAAACVRRHVPAAAVAHRPC